MYRFTGNTIGVDELRVRLVKMSNADLLRFGRAAAAMGSPEANLGEPPREVFVIQLEEARAEWKRRRYENNSAGEIATVEHGLSHLAYKKANNDGLS
jgi:hypothetical protein